MLGSVEKYLTYTLVRYGIEAVVLLVAAVAACFGSLFYRIRSRKTKTR